MQALKDLRRNRWKSVPEASERLHLVRYPQQFLWKSYASQLECSKRSAKHTNRAVTKFCSTEGTVEGTGFADMAGLTVSLLYFVKVLMRNSASAVKAAESIG